MSQLERPRTPINKSARPAQSPAPPPQTPVPHVDPHDDQATPWTRPVDPNYSSGQDRLPICHDLPLMPQQKREAA